MRLSSFAMSICLNLVICAATCAAPAMPIEVSLGSDSARSQLVWLDFGNVAANTSKALTLNVRNVSGEAIVLDAFSWSAKVRVQWARLAANSDFRNRITLNPGQQESLTIDAYFMNNDPDPKMISLMTADSEVVQIISKEVVLLQPRVSKRADQSPGAFWFSGNGNDWSGWYELHLHDAPPGYTLDPNSVQVQVKDIGVEGHLRRCGAWAVCQITQRDDNDVSAKMSVQGAHEGGLMNTDSTVRFTAELTAEYTVKQSVKLSSVDYSYLRTTDGSNQSVVQAASKLPYAANSHFSISQIAGDAPLHQDLFFTTAPAPTPLATAAPSLYQACQASLEKKQPLTSCLVLAHWVFAQTSRANHVDEAAELYTKVCKGGYSRGCTELALLGRFTEPAATATEQLRRACEMGDGLACYDLGQQIEQRNGKTDASAAQLYAKACHLRFPAPGCENSFAVRKQVTATRRQKDKDATRRH